MTTTDTARALQVASGWLLLTAVLTLAPHAVHLPGWLSGLCALLLAWRALNLRQTPTGAHRALVAAIAIATAVALRIEFGHFLGKDPGIAMLAVLLCLKQLEVRRARDIRAAVLLGFFLQLGLFLHDQSLPFAALAFTGTFFALLTLVALHDHGAPAREHVRTARLLAIQAAPFVLVLFVLFPRIPGPLWGLPSDAWSGMTGLSDTMTPGSISQLGLSGAIAFRAEFIGAPPPPSQRYWRGPVLTDFDGRSWRPAHAPTSPSPRYAPQGTAYAYRLTLEPHDRPWLLALEFPDGNLPATRHTSDFQLLAETPVRTRMRFDLRSFPDTPVGLDEAATVLDAARRLPPNSNPRALALGRRLADGAASADEILERVLAHLRELGLTYTLRPPLLGTHTVDGFLFETRRGFCEHFSSAFVVLMRAAGVPARVVTGYQGGEINPVDGSLVVRQSDAHAWAEVWLPQRGWVRVDPTALAAPERIEGGLAAALPQGEPLPLLMRPAWSWLRGLRHQWEALSNAWNQSVLGYNTERQRQLLSRIGVRHADWKALGMLLGASAGTLTLLLLVWVYARQHHADPLDRAWATFCRKLARKGMGRLPWEGPMDYAERLAKADPQHAATVREIAASYARLRYGRDGACPPDALGQLVKRIKDFHIK
jgi:transglutaminase-like putative cysteine protease